MKTRLGDSSRDGEYEMEVGGEGRLVRVYCHLMNTSSPREFLTLPATKLMDNYSHIFSRRLTLPNVCSQEEASGARNVRWEIKLSSCLLYFAFLYLSEGEEEEEEEVDCVPERTALAGLTLWSKAALDLATLSLELHDFTFSRQVRGERVPLATAGDCYSTAGCPRGGFSLNLAGTGLVVAEDTVWVEEGLFTASNITRHQVSYRHTTTNPPTEG